MRDGDEMVCDSCGRSMTNLTGTSVVGTIITPGLGEDPEIRKTMAQQWSPYPLREYHVCWACTLKAHGVPVPEIISEEGESSAESIGGVR